MARAIMIQGTGSNVGKSLIVAGLCRLFARRGCAVAPFKPQNMSNNAAVTIDGGEIGRAQALQARAALRDPVNDMNPVLLKPESESGAQIVVQGRRWRTASARDYLALKPRLLAAARESFTRLAATADLVIVEGAGSPAEINLRAGDIANMGFAEALGLPVVLVGDIDRGGVIAQIVGTHAVLSARDRGRIRGFIVNRFRGDPSLFADGMAAIETHTGWPTLGLLPWFEAAALLPGEDTMDAAPAGGGPVKIAVPQLRRMANFDDLDPLRAEPDVTLEIVPPGHPLPGDAALVLLPGSKSTRADLEHFRRQGWDIDLAAHLRRGGEVLGICGGYQMLGREIRDPEGVEGAPGVTEGLGLLDIVTEMTGAKTTRLVTGRALEGGFPVTGYEIHVGRTTGDGLARPWLEIAGRQEGAVSADGKVRGTYVHGLFAADDFRRAFLARLGAGRFAPAHEARMEAILDDWADHLATHLDIPALERLAATVDGKV